MRTASTTAIRLPAVDVRRALPALRFVGTELLLWASIYLAYLAVRGATIGSADEAYANGGRLVDAERAVGIFHEGALQSALSPIGGIFSTYYMLGFFPVVATTLVWLAARHRAAYRRLRTALLVSLSIATVGFVAFPAAPPRLMPELGIADTVGLSGSHDEGSFGGVKFNPYAAMPSMHVGWTLLVGIVGFSVARRRLARAAFAAHPAMMVVTVSATGNHYFLDSAVGATVALSGLALATLAVARLARAGDGEGRSPGRRPAFPRLSLPPAVPAKLAAVSTPLAARRPAPAVARLAIRAGPDPPYRARAA